MAKEYPNYYENVKEANMRLQHTVVMYEDVPHYIYCICDHMNDGVFRVYMEAIGNEKGIVQNYHGGVPCDHPDTKIRGAMMDEWLTKNPKMPIIRKMMNSPKFNRFRPFPFGMANYKGKTYYLERQPQRHTQQGLTQQMVYSTEVKLASELKLMRSSGSPIDITTAAFRECVDAKYPSIDVCLENLANPDVINEAVAFHREFAVISGPIHTMFIAYKADIIGFLPAGDTSAIHVARDFAHTKEVIESLGLFSKIVVKK